MVKYSTFVDKRGIRRFRKTDDSLPVRKTKLIAQADIPPEVLAELVNKMDLLDGLQVETVDDSADGQGQSKQEAQPVSTDCIFCGAYGNRRKFVEMRTVRLCEEDWQTKTTGEVVGKLRETQLA